MAAYWWNPFVWQVSRHVSELREQICDDLAALTLRNRQEYATTLVAMAERVFGSSSIPSAIGIGASEGQLQRRIRRILHADRLICVGLGRMAAVGVIGAAGLMVISAACAQAQVADQTDEATDERATPPEFAEASTDYFVNLSVIEPNDRPMAAFTGLVLDDGKASAGTIVQAWYMGGVGTGWGEFTTDESISLFRLELYTKNRNPQKVEAPRSKHH